MRISFYHPVIRMATLVLLPFASSMAARAIAYLDIFDWLRKPFTTVTPLSSGVGDCVNPKAGSVVGGLMSCINCAGMWSTVLLIALYACSTSVGTLTVLALGATSIGILFTRMIERTEWQSRLAQEQAGQLNKQNKVAWFEARDVLYEVSDAGK